MHAQAWRDRVLSAIDDWHERHPDSLGPDGPALRARLAAGERVLVHCKGGLGRTGLVAARLLVEFGVAPADAVARVRAARPGAIETERQLAYVLGLRKA